jgi:hypothetical protein
VHFQRVRPRALSSGSHGYGSSCIDRRMGSVLSLCVNSELVDTMVEVGPEGSIDQQSTLLRDFRFQRFWSHQPIIFPIRKLITRRSEGLEGLTPMLFPIANNHDNPWLLPKESCLSVLRTRKTFPFWYFPITIFLISHPEQVRDLGLEIQTARGSRESILFRRVVSELHDIS